MGGACELSFHLEITPSCLFQIPIRLLRDGIGFDAGQGAEGGWSGDGQPLELFSFQRGKPIERVGHGKNMVLWGKHELPLYYIQITCLSAPAGKNELGPLLLSWLVMSSTCHSGYRLHC